MARVEGFDKVHVNLQRHLSKARGDDKAGVVVGYTAAYALEVHEKVWVTFKVGQAKFLEQPARSMGRQLSQVIRDTVRDGARLSLALLKAGMMLQASSQKICPVDTGMLRNSAFTRQE